MAIAPRPLSFRGVAPERFSVIHFTSHAVANTESPLDSAVILSGPDQAYKLYARDVAALPLKADLVTVSACRSAGERAYAGEGLVGFAWAFLRAGSAARRRRAVGRGRPIDGGADGQVYARIAAGASPAVRSVRPKPADEERLRQAGTTGRHSRCSPWLSESSFPGVEPTLALSSDAPTIRVYEVPWKSVASRP